MSDWNREPSPCEGKPEWWWIQFPRGKKGWEEPKAVKTWLEEVVMVGWPNIDSPSTLESTKTYGAWFCRIPFPKED